MAVRVTAIMLGVKDLSRSKAFYQELGCRLDQDHPSFASFDLGEGTSLALYEWNAAARDAGVQPEGSGFRGVSLHHIVGSADEVDDTMRTAEGAGGTVVKAAGAGEWGGYFGYFSDPDGHLWKVASQ